MTEGRTDDRLDEEPKQSESITSQKIIQIIEPPKEALTEEKVKILIQ